MSVLLNLIIRRSVRRMIRSDQRAPWPFQTKAVRKHCQVGPFHDQKWEWPIEDYPEFPMSCYRDIDPTLAKYMGEQPTGYVDLNTGKYVHVPEMVPELVVPDLTGFKLKPYVSYKTDVEIEVMLERIKTKGMDKIDEDQVWPPEPTTARRLFDDHYGEKVRDAFEKGKYDSEDFSIFEEEDEQNQNQSVMIGTDEKSLQ